MVLKEKIYENISQFGKICKNNYFMKFIKEEFCNIRSNNNKIFEEKIFQHNNYILGEKEVIRENNSNNEGEDGLFSSIKFALGFGSTNDNNNSNEK